MTKFAGEIFSMKVWKIIVNYYGTCFVWTHLIHTYNMYKQYMYMIYSLIKYVSVIVRIFHYNLNT